MIIMFRSQRWNAFHLFFILPPKSPCVNYHLDGGYIASTLILL